MNRYSILLFYLLFVSLAIHSQGFNSLAQKGLKGMVKSIKSVCYNTAEYSDNIYKTSVITTEQQNRDIPLYPTYVCEYNEDGNIVEKTIYDELGVCLCVYAYKYKGNIVVMRETLFPFYDDFYNGELLTIDYWSITFDGERPVSQYFFSRVEMYPEEDDLRNQKFEGFNVKSYDRYVDGVLEERVENTWNNNLLTKYVSKDKNGNITYMLTNIWSESGQLLHTYVESENDVFFDSYEYNKDGFLVKYLSRLNAKEEEEHTFKYLSYDYNGNWTKRIIYIQDKAYIEERTITYYTNL